MLVLPIVIGILQLHWLFRHCCISHYLSGPVVHVQILAIEYVPAMHLLSWHMLIHPTLRPTYIMSVAYMSVVS
jgi:hypothetical protein